MEKKKLEEFITRLSDPNLPEDQQSFILMSEDDDVCAGDNLGTCENSQYASCKGENASCVNYRVCGESTNGADCKNLEQQEKADSFCIFSSNFFRSCQG